MSYAPQSQSPQTAPAYQGFSPEQPPAQSSGCGWTSCLLGCAGMLLITVVACGIGSWWVYKQAPIWAADFARNMVVSGINESDLSAEDKTAIIAQVDRVVDAYKAGKITNEDLGKVMEALSKSPLLPLGVMWGLEEKYIKPSGLTDDEKAEARLTLQRIVRGGFEKTITEEEFQPLLDEVSIPQPPNPDGSKRPPQLKENLTDEELRAFIVKAKKLADDKMIPEEEFKVDIGAEVKRAVDEALKGKGL